MNGKLAKIIKIYHSQSYYHHPSIPLCIMYTEERWQYFENFKKNNYRTAQAISS